MQFVSKKVIAFNMLLLNFSISFGCSNQGNQILSDDNFLTIGANGNGKVKNTLRRVNKFIAARLSINNNDFLLSADLSLISTLDKETILLKALYEKNILVEKRFEKTINEFQIQVCSEVESIIKITNNEVLLPIKFSLEEMKEVLQNNVSFDAFSFHSLLQKMILYGDFKTVENISSNIKPVFCNKMSSNACEKSAKIYNVNLLKGYIMTRIFLEEAMRRNQIEVFRIIAETDPFCLANITCIEDRCYAPKGTVEIYQSILESLKNVKIHESKETQKKLCVEIYKKTVKEDISLEEYLLQKKKKKEDKRLQKSLKTKSLNDNDKNNEDDNECRCNCVIL